jgi:gluconolactonase
MRNLSRLLTIAGALAMTLISSARAAEFDIRDPAEFEKIIPKDAKVEKLAGDLKFIEGPIWIPAGAEATALPANSLLFSDIVAGKMLKWTKGGVETFRDPSNQSNGNTLDREGRLVTCEHLTRRVTRTGKDGKVETIADKFGGKKFNAPNDVVVKSDGSVYFTDPPYGGHPDLEQPKNYVFRISPLKREVQIVCTVDQNPNGLCFSPDESKLYVADSGKAHAITAFVVKPDGSVGEGKPFATIDKGAPDGIKCDVAGRIWSSAGDGIHIFSPDGKLIGKVLIPETAANLTFGGDDGKTLFITAKTGLYAVQTNVTAAPRLNAK